MIEIAAFTGRGADLAVRLTEALPGSRAFAPERHCTGPLRPLTERVADWAGARFQKGNVLIFVGAAGIAVRAVAPHIRGKDADPAVLCLDEAGRYVIPLLSGHLGGANRMAREIAALTGGTAVLTTATDVNGIFSPDAWAAENGCAVADPKTVKAVAAALLEGEPVGFSSSFPVAGTLPAGLEARTGLPRGIEIALAGRHPFPHTLHLIPRCIVAGMGCRRGVEESVLLRRLEETLAEQNLPLAAVGTVASIDLKAEEPGLLALCRTLDAPLLTFSAAELMALPGDFTPSRRVLEATGADNVCERAAVRAGGELLTRKSSGDGVTVALARLPWAIRF